MPNEKEFERLAGISEAALLEDIGNEILARDQTVASRYLGQRMTQRERALAAANAWFASNREMLKKRICENQAVREAFSAEPGAVVELSKVVADALLGAGGIFPLVTISMLIARKGLAFICDEGA